MIIQALHKKLGRDRDTLLLQQHQTDKEKEQILLQYQQTSLALTAAQSIPATILPEQAIQQLPFVMQLQSEQDRIHTALHSLSNTAGQIKKDLVAIKTRLKLLEKYQKNKENSSMKNIRTDR